jgi:hypothetical protein
MMIEEAKALGASVLFIPEGKAFTLPNPGGNVSSAVIPDPNDEAYIDLVSIESWEASRTNPADVRLYDSSTGVKRAYDELELGGDLEYKFTTNVLLAFIIGLFFRSATPLNASSYQFNPDSGTSPRGWLVLDNRDQGGNLILTANLWGKLKYTGSWKGGAGEVVKPELTFVQLKNSLNTMAIGTP